jgi:hypothetical protein
MKKTITLFLGLLLLLLLLVAGAVAYLYTSGGNEHLRTYLEDTLQEQTHLPVTFHAFKLTRGHLYFIATLGREASLGFDGSFDLLHRRLSGRYLFKAKQAHYQGYLLRQADIAGHVHGTIADLKLDGKGTLLDGPLNYSLSIREQIPQDVTLQASKLPLDELLVLAGQPQIAQGELNADVLMPSIGKKGSRGRMVVQLKHARFDPATIAKLYHYTLPPEKTALRGEVHAKLEGELVRFDAKILSDLVTVHLQNGQANITDKNIACDAAIDAQELAPLTQDSLHGPLKFSGSFKYDAIGIQGHAATRSFGGKISIDYTKNIRVRIQNVSLEKLLRLAGKPNSAQGKINGRLTLNSPKVLDGHYALKLTEGTLHTEVINADLGTALPKHVSLMLDSKGTFAQGILSAQTHLVSNLLQATLAKIRFDMAGKTFSTQYRLHIPNPLLLTGKKGKGVPVTLSGTASQKKTLHVSGSAKGLGKKLTFDYADNRLNVIADDVAVGRLLASAGQPVAVSGLADAHIDLTTLDPLSGKILLRAADLKTHPAEMKHLIGKPLDTHLSFALSGQAKKGILFAKSTLKSPLATLSLPQVVFDTEDNALSTPFTLQVPDLRKLEPLIDTKLNGALVTKGKIKAGSQTHISGSSTSLGGTVMYRYAGTRSDIKVKDVPVIKLLHLVNQPEQFLGTANGSLTYDTASRKGLSHFSIDRFQFKPGKMTAGIKLILHKDLAQIIYDRTTIDARFNGDLIAYKVVAHGRRSDFAMRDGKLNTQAQTHKASFGLRVDAIDVIGTIKGSIKDPKIVVLPGKLLRNKLKKKVIDKVAPKIKKEIEKNIEGSTKKLIKNLPKLF